MPRANTPCPWCGRPKKALSRLCRGCFDAVTDSAAPPPSDPIPPAEQITTDRQASRVQTELTVLRAKYKEALQTIERQEAELGVAAALREGVETFAITPKEQSNTSEATPVLVASDWHVEEKVGAEVGGLNRYTLDIAKQRATTFFQAGLRLIDLLAQDVKISTVVLALLGDFISNDIHDEVAEVAEIPPTHAIATAQNFLISGIEFLLNHSAYSFVIPCHSGNHGRTTKTTRFATENGHSLEYLMYLHLAAYFRNEPRLTFIIPDGMHSYLKVYDQTIRFHHGHAIKYGGGVGGIFVPAYKAIAQWDKAKRADLTVIGHFHQMKDGGNFLCNGSLIGYNAFALSIKADYEKPRQALFLIDKKRGRTCTWPILVS